MSIAAQLALALDAAPPDVGERIDRFMPRRLSELASYLREAETVLAGDHSGAFAAAFPTPVLRSYGSMPLYRAHVRELARRARDGEDARPGTDAECLAALMETALKAPLRPEGQAMVDRLVRRVVPDAVHLLTDPPAPERWEGQAEEDIRELRRKLTQADRAFRRRAA